VAAALAILALTCTFGIFLSERLTSFIFQMKARAFYDGMTDDMRL